MTAAFSTLFFGTGGFAGLFLADRTSCAGVFVTGVVFTGVANRDVTGLGACLVAGCFGLVGEDGFLSVFLVTFFVVFAEIVVPTCLAVFLDGLAADGPLAFETVILPDFDSGFDNGLDDGFDDGRVTDIPFFAATDFVPLRLPSLLNAVTAVFGIAFFGAAFFGAVFFGAV